MSSLKATPVIPLIQAEDTKIAVQIAEALRAGGLTTLEVVLRTDAAMKCMEAIVAEVEGVTVGAGTVLTPAQANEAADCGAQFIVSPGLNADVVAASKARGLEIYPGCMTASEVQLAWNLGLRTVKFFPAELAGGVPMLKAFSSVFRQMSFMPTGGISADNLKSYLEVPAVVACGGSWLTPAADINAGNFDAITTLAREAMDLARQVRPNI
jgi:2-dehydro-3-deoxyphosphogluconate aldolase/(4S)-4-hydroxy-2-oxoglutarate aldolase